MERFEMEKEKPEKCKNFSNISMVELRRKQSLKRMITSNVEGILKAMFDLLVGKSGVKEAENRAYKEGTNNHSNQFVFTSLDRQLSKVSFAIENGVVIFVQSNY